MATTLKITTKRCDTYHNLCHKLISHNLATNLSPKWQFVIHKVYYNITTTSTSTTTTTTNNNNNNNNM